MDVTKIVNYSKKEKKSFFIILLYIVLKGLNSVDEMRMRIIDDKPFMFDDINPAFTVMTKKGTFENVRCQNIKNFNKFYNKIYNDIENTKCQNSLKEEKYNPVNCFNEYYITCTPWIDFVQVTHPIPDDKQSQCVPRICWGKYIKQKEKYILTLNITVSHIFVDGYPLSKVFNNIQEYLDNFENIILGDKNE